MKYIQETRITHTKCISHTRGLVHENREDEVESDYRILAKEYEEIWIKVMLLIREKSKTWYS